MHTIRQEREYLEDFSDQSCHILHKQGWKYTNNWEVGYLSYSNDPTGGSNDFKKIATFKDRIAAIQFAMMMNGGPQPAANTLEQFLSNNEVKEECEELDVDGHSINP